MWTFEKNTDSLIENFASVVEADVASKGNGLEDFTLLCQKYNVIPCPYIKHYRDNEVPDKEGFKIINGNIDLSSWRSMLLACCCVASKVQEITVHNCQVTTKHLQDLAIALRKMGTCKAIKLQYLQLDISQGTDLVKMKEFQDALVGLLSDSTCLEYISLKGNNFSDEFIAPLVPALAENFKLTSLNLSFNYCTDITLISLLKAIRITTNIKYISLSSNQIQASDLSILTSTLLGTDSITVEEEARVKSISKLIGDRNKAIKDSNKKRKKSGNPDIPEIIPSLDCTIKRDGKLIVMNRSLLKLDLSDNHLISSENIKRFHNSISKISIGSDDTVVSPAAIIMNDNKIQIDLQGCCSNNNNHSLNNYSNEGDIDMNRNPQPWLELLL